LTCSTRGRIIADLVNRGIAQSGSAPALGAGCREFESLYPDQIKNSSKYLCFMWHE
jgi:hypothetical protein